MKSSMQIRNELAEVTAKAEALGDLLQTENREAFNAEEAAEIENLTKQQEILNKSLDSAIKYETLVANRLKPQIDKVRNVEGGQDPRKTVPIRFSSVQKPAGFSTSEDAYKAGQWCMALLGNKKARAYCKDQGLRFERMVENAMTTGDNTKGGFLVPEPLESAVIVYRQQYGIFSRFAQQWNMAGAVDNAPKLLTEMTVYGMGENTTITASDLALGLVRLEARKIGGVGVISSELSEDSVISVADLFAQSAAFKFTYAEDDAGFNGDGSSTYYGITGCEGVFTNSLYAGSVVTATGQTTVSALTVSSLEAATGKLPEYAGISPAWFFHKNVWANGPQRLLDALGGNSMTNVAEGAPKMLLGYPVYFTQVLRSAPTTGQIYGYFGDLRFASILGRRRGMTMAVDNSIYFLQDSTALRVTERFDINVHDRGDTSNAGSLLALKLG